MESQPQKFSMARKLLRSLLWMIFLGGVSLLGIHLGLRTSPLRLGGIEKLIDQTLFDWNPELARTSGSLLLRWDNLMEGPFLEVHNIGLEDGASNAHAELRLGRLRIEPLRLLIGHVVVKHLELEGLDVFLRRNADGAVCTPHFAQTDAPPRPGGNLLGTRGAPDLVGRLRRIDIKQLSVKIVDDDMVPHVEFLASTFALNRSRRAIALSGSGTLSDGKRQAVFTIGGGTFPDSADRSALITLEFQSLSPVLLASLSGRLAELRNLETSLSGAIGAVLERDGRVRLFTFSFESGPGIYSATTTRREDGLHFDRLLAEGNWYLDEDLAVLEIAELALADATMRIFDAKLSQGVTRLDAGVELTGFTTRTLEAILPDDWLHRDPIADQRSIALVPRAEGGFHLRLDRGKDGVRIEELQANLRAWFEEAQIDTDPKVTFSIQGNRAGADWEATLKDLSGERFLEWLGARMEGITCTFPLSGRINGTLGQNGPGFAADLSSSAGHFVAPGLLHGPLAAESVQLRASIAPGARDLKVDLLEFRRGDMKLALAGTINTAPAADPVVQASFSIKGLDLDVIDGFWPVTFAPLTYSGMRDVVLAARVEEASGIFEVGPSHRPQVKLDLNRLSGTGRFSDVTVDTRVGLPFFTNLGGYARFDQDRLDFDVKKGVWNRATVEKGRVSFPDIRSENPKLEIEVALSGDAKAFSPLSVLAPEALREALRDATSNSQGTGSLDLTVKFPLIRDLALSDTEISGKLALTGASLAFPAIGLESTGVDSLLTLVNSKDTFSFSQRASSKLVRIGDWFRGPLHLDFDYTDSDGVRLLSFDGNAPEAAARMPFVALEKTPGEPAAFQGRLLLSGPNTVVLEEGRLAFAEFTTRGSGAFRIADGALSLESLNLSDIKGPGTSAAIEIRREADDFQLRTDGGTWNLRRWVEPAGLASGVDSVLPPAPPGSPVRIQIDGTMDALEMREDLVLRTVEISAALTGSRFDRLQVSAKLPGDAPLTARIAGRDADGVQTWSFEAGNSGEAARLLGMRRVIEDGSVRASGTIRPAGENLCWDGKVEVDNFRVTNAPLAARVLTAAALTGIANLARGRGVGFTTLHAGFSLKGNDLRIRELAGYGAELGLIVPRGDVSLDTGSIQAEGTLWPAHALNIGFRSIPILREMLTGPEGQGLIGISFEARGTLDEPEIQTSPVPRIGILSALSRLLGLRNRTAEPDSGTN